MSDPTFRLERYVFELCFDMHVPREIEPLAENLIRAIPGVEEAYVHHDWAEIKVLQEYVDEVEDPQDFWDALRSKALEAASCTQAACLLLTKIEGKP